MIKEAIEKIEKMAVPVIEVIEGRSFALGPNNQVTEVRPELDMIETRRLHSLDALVKMIKTEAMQMKEDHLFISVTSPTYVFVFTHPHEDLRWKRILLYEVNATDVPGWDESVQMGFEEAMIALRTRFQESADSDYALKLLSDITTGSKVTYNDNGIATSIVTQSGVALQSNQKIRPIITLRPYRTFQEVEQPSSQFLIRVNERGIKFVEADGGMWRLAARKTVKDYLEQSLASEVKEGRVVVAL